ncbi:MAG: hypothetical protein H7Y38_01810, partial [Armatimonadetes bacterium]|nr:hypothetical protein [Armatimonadota bacterium]
MAKTRGEREIAEVQAADTDARKINAAEAISDALPNPDSPVDTSGEPNKHVPPPPTFTAISLQALVTYVLNGFSRRPPSSPPPQSVNLPELETFTRLKLNTRLEDTSNGNHKLTNCNMTGLTMPIAEYDHSEG